MRTATKSRAKGTPPPTPLPTSTTTRTAMAPRLYALLLLCASSATADLVLSRSIEALTIGSVNTTLEGTACASKDKYGSNDCHLKWGSTYKADVTAALTKDLGEGVTMTADLTIDGLIPFQFSCKVCGANCTITVPIIKEKVSIPAPPCPIKARTLKQSMSFSLPTAPPIKMQAGFDGTVLLADASGAQLLKMSVKAETAPGQAAMQMLASEAT